MALLFTATVQRTKPLYPVFMAQQCMLFLVPTKVILLRLLNQLGRATVNFPSSDKVIHNTQNKNKSEDRARPVQHKKSFVSFTFARTLDKPKTDQFISFGVVPLKSGKKLITVDVNM